MTVDERFNKLIEIANNMPEELTNDLQGVAITTLAHMDMFIQLAFICKDQEKRIKVLEKLAGINDLYKPVN